MSSPKKHNTHTRSNSDAETVTFDTCSGENSNTRCSTYKNTDQVKEEVEQHMQHQCSLQVAVAPLPAIHNSNDDDKRAFEGGGDGTCTDTLTTRTTGSQNNDDAVTTCNSKKINLKQDQSQSIQQPLSSEIRVKNDDNDNDDNAPKAQKSTIEATRAQVSTSTSSSNTGNKGSPKPRPLIRIPSLKSINISNMHSIANSTTINNNSTVTDNHNSELDTSQRSLPSTTLSLSTATAGTVTTSKSRRGLSSSIKNIPSYPATSEGQSLSNSPSKTTLTTLNPGQTQQSQTSSSLLQSFHYPKRHKLPKPRKPISSCPLLCVFYAEFDDIVGPTIVYQSPPNFMDSDIEITSDEIDSLLTNFFYSDESNSTTANNNNNCSNHSHGNDDNNNVDSDMNHNTSNENDLTIKKNDNESIQNVENANTKNEKEDIKQKNNNDYCGDNNLHNHSQPLTPQQDQEPSYSIFDSTSEYIITGHEMLTGQIISLSTHNMHILSFPIIIQNTQRYKRNSLLFSVGFVIRRVFDPLPFRNILAKLTSTFQSMELESAYLSHEQTRDQIQGILDAVIRCLNSPSSECHLLLNDANILHLQYFPPPKAPEGPVVPDYVVPVLLRPEWQLQSLDWDLTINWIVPHLDGVKYVKLIAESSQVDPEVVRACLRVLRHHNAIAFVDIFQYDNIYVCTEKAQRILAGDSELEGLLEEAYKFVLKHSHISSTATKGSDSIGGGSYSNNNNAHSNQYIPHSQASYGTNSNNTMLYNSPSQSHSHPPLSTSYNTVSSLYLHTVREIDQKSLMKALAILYASCQRNATIRDVLISKLVDTSNNIKDKNASPNNNEKSIRFDNIKQPSKHRCASVDSTSSSSSDKSDYDDAIDWKGAFEIIDHIRFVTFGIIHGLIERLHEYPMAIDIAVDELEDDIGTNNNDNSDQFDSSTKNKEMNEYSFSREIKKNSYSSIQLNHQGPSMSRSFSLNFSPTVSKLSRSSVGGFRDEAKGRRTDRELALEIASHMNGQRCDDELSCMFQRPIAQLKDIVINKAKKDVISIFQRG